jgi:hypothetical protein
MGVINGSISFGDDDTYESLMSQNRKSAMQILPNGQYKVTVRSWNEKDNNIMTAVVLLTIKVFTNEDPF